MKKIWDTLQYETLSAMGYAPYALAKPELLDDDPLMRALLRAAGCDSNSPEMVCLLKSLPSLHVLRSSGDEKRRIWPQLRRMRRMTQERME